jgi:hypothetical protein
MSCKIAGFLLFCLKVLQNGLYIHCTIHAALFSRHIKELTHEHILLAARTNIVHMCERERKRVRDKEGREEEGLKVKEGEVGRTEKAVGEGKVRTRRHYHQVHLRCCCRGLAIQSTLLQQMTHTYNIDCEE